MANSKQIVDWLFNNKKELGLNVVKADWPGKWLPGFKCVHVVTEVKGCKVTGTGIDADSDTAFLKAISENLERTYCSINGIHSSGIAAHYNKEEALKNAKNELIERDHVLCSYLTGRGFLPANNNFIDGLNQGLKPHDIRLSLYQVGAEGSSCYLCIATSIKEIPGFSAFIGAGYDSNIDKCIQKAIVECYMSVVYYLEKKNNIKTLSYNDYLRKELYGPEDHKRLYASPEMSKNILELTKSYLPLSNTINNDDIECRLLCLESLGLSSPPIYIYKAESKNLQPMFYGKVDTSKLNIPRLKEFAGSNISVENLNKYPHFIG